MRARAAVTAVFILGVACSGGARLLDVEMAVMRTVKQEIREVRTVSERSDFHLKAIFDAVPRGIVEDVIVFRAAKNEEVFGSCNDALRIIASDGNIAGDEFGLCADYHRVLTEIGRWIYEVVGESDDGQADLAEHALGRGRSAVLQSDEKHEAVKFAVRRFLDSGLRLFYTDRGGLRDDTGLGLDNRGFGRVLRGFQLAALDGCLCSHDDALVVVDAVNEPRNPQPESGKSPTRKISEWYAIIVLLCPFIGISAALRLRGWRGRAALIVGWLPTVLTLLWLGDAF